MGQYMRMPRLSQDMTRGRILDWLKKEGDAVREGEPLVSVESEKAEVELQAPQSGVLRRVLVTAGQAADVGAPLAILAAAEENIADLLKASAVPSTAAGQSATVLPTAPLPSTTPGLTPRPPGKRQPVSPAAKRLARDLGVDLPGVIGTGADGLVTEADVRASAARMAEHVQVIPLTGLRRRIAERLSLSRQTAADVTTVVDVDMTEVAALKKASGLSYTAYVIWATAQALRKFPILNSTLEGDRILVKQDIHLGVAVSLEDGLVVPVIRSADRKTVEEIAREMDALARQARERQLGPVELTGSTFTVTNSGAFGSLLFTPIINHPEVAILGIGKVADTPAVREGAIVIRKIMYLCLSYDHRVVDGAPAVQFLQEVKQQLERPSVRSIV